MQIFSGTPETRHQSQLSRILSPPFPFAPLRPAAAPSLLIAAPGRPIAATAAAVAASRPAAPLLGDRMVRIFAGFTRSTGLTPPTAGRAVSGRKTKSPPWAAQCSRRPHFSPGFGVSSEVSCRYRCGCVRFSSQVRSCSFRSAIVRRRWEANFSLGKGDQKTQFWSPYILGFFYSRRSVQAYSRD